AALRRGEIVALQGDRALGTRGDVLQPFFGAPAAFPLGPFVLARAAGAPVVPAFCVLDADRRYRVVVGAPSSVEAGGAEAAPRRGPARPSVAARPEAREVIDRAPRGTAGVMSERPPRMGTGPLRPPSGSP